MYKGRKLYFHNQKHLLAFETYLQFFSMDK